MSQNDLFHEQFSTRLQEYESKQVVNFNLGWPGASNDFITRMLFLSYPVIKPDIVLINFTCPCRREYASELGRLLYYRPLPKENAITDPILKEYYSHLFSLTSMYDDQLNFFRAYKGIEAYLKNSRWIFSVTDIQDLKMLEGHIDKSKCAGVLLQPDENDVGRDFSHPGKFVHKRLSEQYWNVYQKYL